MPDPSRARLAAEAAFAKRPVTSVSEAGPRVVVVKRKRAVVPDPAGHFIEAEVPAPLAEARAPRVFRVDAPIVASDPAVEGAEQLVEGASRDFAEAAGPQKKRRRRTLHGEVTIVRPADPQVPVESEPAARRTLGPAQDFDLGIPTSDRDAPSRYQALIAEIDELKGRAEAAKSIEAARAVRWIKRAIATYGLSASDIGL